MADVQSFDVSGIWIKPERCSAVAVRCEPSDAPSSVELLQGDAMPSEVAVTVATGEPGSTSTSFGPFFTVEGIAGEPGTCLVISW